MLLEGLRRLEYRGYDSAGMVTSAAGASCTCGRRPGGMAESCRSTVAAHPARRRVRHQPHAVGHPRRGDRPQRPPARVTPPATSPSSTTASSRTTCRAEAPTPGGRRRVPHPTPIRRCWRTSSAKYYQGDLVGGRAARALALRPKGTYGIGVVCRQRAGADRRRRGSAARWWWASGTGRPPSWRQRRQRPGRVRRPGGVPGQDRQIWPVLRGDESWVDPRPAPEPRWSSTAAWTSPAFLGEAGDAEKGDYPHYMLKEIYEQPETLDRGHAGPAGRQPTPPPTSAG